MPESPGFTHHPATALFSMSPEARERWVLQPLTDLTALLTSDAGPALARDPLELTLLATEHIAHSLERLCHLTTLEAEVHRAQTHR